MQTHLTATNVTKTHLVSLLTILEEVPDPRVTATVDHDLPDLLTSALCTILCGGESFYDREEFGPVRLDGLKTFLRLRNGTPTHDTCNRVFQALDPEHFGECLSRWTQSVRTVLGGEARGAGRQDPAPRVEQRPRPARDRQRLGHGKRLAAGPAQRGASFHRGSL